MCDTIYIDNTQKIIKKRTDGNLPDVKRLLKNEKKNQTNLLPISNNTLNILRHVWTYISA